MRILALSLDLDDTLWPVMPVLEHAERQLDAWLQERCPQVAQRFPIDQMRRLRERLAQDNPHLAHDFRAQRRMTLEHALNSGGSDYAALLEDAYETFCAARNQVEPYPDALPALERLAERMPLISISNGNADLARIGLDHHFRFSLSACVAGIAKPDAGIFRQACERLGLPPQNVLHVGDDPAMDVAGAHAAGLRAGWLNRNGATWQEARRPDLEIDNLTALADWCDAQSTAVN